MDTTKLCSAKTTSIIRFSGLPAFKSRMCYFYCTNSYLCAAFAVYSHLRFEVITQELLMWPYIAVCHSEVFNFLGLVSFLLFWFWFSFFFKLRSLHIKQLHSEGTRRLWSLTVTLFAGLRSTECRLTSWQM